MALSSTFIIIIIIIIIIIFSFTKHNQINKKITFLF